MHHALDRRQRVIGDRIGTLVRRGDQFGGIRDELQPDRIVRPLDQRLHRRRDGNCVAPLDPRHTLDGVTRNKPRRGQRLGVTQGLLGHGGRR